MIKVINIIEITDFWNKLQEICKRTEIPIIIGNQNTLFIVNYATHLPGFQANLMFVEEKV
jgi:hypothetical protein